MSRKITIPQESIFTAGCAVGVSTGADSIGRWLGVLILLLVTLSLVARENRPTNLSGTKATDDPVFTNFRVGQLWAPQDPRVKAAHVEIIGLSDESAFVEYPGGRVASIKLSRLKPGVRGYKLVRDV